MEDGVKQFLSVSSGSGYGRGDGRGDGSGYGSGYGRGDGRGDGRGYGRGDGSGYGRGDGRGDGSGYGRGYGRGDGSGYGSGDGRGYGRGYGSEDGSGYGRGYGSEDGSGYGRGYGSGINQFNGEPVYLIDGLPTILHRIHGDIARAVLLNDDLTLTPCWVAKVGNSFAHGKTAHEAREAAISKAFNNIPESERIAAFRATFVNATEYPNTLFFAWHHRLTGSCEMGRRQFAKEHGIDVEHGSMTPEAFIRLTENDYGGTTIRKLRPLYGMQ